MKPLAGTADLLKSGFNDYCAILYYALSTVLSIYNIFLNPCALRFLDKKWP